MGLQVMPGAMTQASQQTKQNEHVQRQLRAASVSTVERAGLSLLNLLYTANINGIQTPEILR